MSNETNHPDGLTCWHCRHHERCKELFQQDADARCCDFDPSRFQECNGDGLPEVEKCMSIREDLRAWTRRYDAQARAWRKNTGIDPREH